MERKHKVGDKICIKSREWYDDNKNEEGKVYPESLVKPCFIWDMSPYFSKEATIMAEFGIEAYLIDIDNGVYHWSDFMFEEEVIFNENIVPKEKTGEPNNVSHPSHYTWLKEKCGIEVIDVTRHLDFDLGNAVKYILRSGHKHECGMGDREKKVEDLQKAIFYLEDEINLIMEEKK